MDCIAESGIVGIARTIPKSLPAGTDVGTMSLLGYNPSQFHTGRAPIEIAARNIEMKESDWAFRCNFVTIRDGKMESFSAGELDKTESQKFLHRLNEVWSPEENWGLFAGFGYRNLAVYRKGLLFDQSTLTTPPHNITGQPVNEYVPRGAGAEELKRLMQLSEEAFYNCEWNQQLVAEDKPPVTGIWLWGQGKKTKLSRFREKFKMTAAMISAVDLPKGLAKLAGMDVIEVVGATGTVDTNYLAKAEAAVCALSKYDLVVIHVEATDQASHEGNVRGKVKALEEIDRHIVGPLHQALKLTGEHRMMVVPDHATLIRTKTHNAEPVPFAVCGTGIERNSYNLFHELSESESPPILDGHCLISILLNRE